MGRLVRAAKLVAASSHRQRNTRDTITITTSVAIIMDKTIFLNISLLKDQIKLQNQAVNELHNGLSSHKYEVNITMM